MTEEIKDTERSVESQPTGEINWQERSEELHGRLVELEESIAFKDSELTIVRESLAGTVARYRTAVLAGSPGVPGELVTGNTVEEIDRSLEIAARIVSDVRQQLEAEAMAGNVPTGAPPRIPPDLSALSPAEKIAHGLTHSPG